MSREVLLSHKCQGSCYKCHTTQEDIWEQKKSLLSKAFGSALKDIRGWKQSLLSKSFWVSSVNLL